MFTSQIETQENIQTKDTENKLITKICGVDVSNYKCYELNHSDPVYKEFNNSTIHYAINAMQKGLKPPTKIGLKRLNKRTLKKKMALQNSNLNPKTSRKLLDVFGKMKNQYNIKPQINATAKPLNPLSPQELCLKSLRTKFREQMEKNKQNDINTVNNSQMRIFVPKAQQKLERHNKRRPKFIRKKENQKKRRAELLYLVDEYKLVLQKIFPAERLQGFHHRSKVPKISRHQIKDGLAKYFDDKRKQFGDQEKIDKMVEEKFRELDENKKWRQRRRLGDDGSKQSSSSSSSSERSCSSEPQQQESSQARKKVKVNQV